MSGRPGREGKWQHSTRRARLPREWSATRLRILTRDNGQCTAAVHVPECDGRATDVDHVDRFGGESDSNLTSLSGACHRAKSSREGVAARVPTTRPRERHPGLC